MVSEPLETTVELFSPLDFEAMHAKGLAMCGHGALAAICKISVEETLQSFIHKRTWVNIPDMLFALQSIQHQLKISGRARLTYGRLAEEIFPARGLVLIQFLGSWMNPGVPPGAACQHTHWAAVDRWPATGEEVIWDINYNVWVRKTEWEARMIPQLIADNPRRTGWKIKRSFFVNYEPHS